VTRRRAVLAVAALAVVGGSIAVVVVHQSSSSPTPSAASCITQPGKAQPVPPVTAPPKTRAWAKQYAISLRTMFHLDASPRAVAAAAANPLSTETDLSTPLTPAEVRQLRTYQLAVGAQSDVDSTAARLQLADYGGVFPDPAVALLLDVVVAHGDCAVLGRLRTALPALTLHAVAARNDASAAVLKHEYKLLNQHFKELVAHGVVVDEASVDAQSNAVVIKLDPSTSAGSDAFVRSLIGSVGVRITHDGQPAIAN
jgi:hypothetical protein